MNNLTIATVHRLCNKNQWFTQGDNVQYEKMFRMVEENAPIEEIATAIWLCTDEKRWCRRDILDELRKGMTPV